MANTRYIFKQTLDCTTFMGLSISFLYSMIIGFMLIIVLSFLYESYILGISGTHVRYSYSCQKRYEVTGSDTSFYDPIKSILERENISVIKAQNQRYQR